MGIGGVGKTRLAIEAAATVTPGREPETPGVFLVALASLTPGPSLDHQLATTIATALHLPLAGADPVPLQLRHYLREKTLLMCNIVSTSATHSQWLSQLA